MIIVITRWARWRVTPRGVSTWWTIGRAARGAAERGTAGGGHQGGRRKGDYRGGRQGGRQKTDVVNRLGDPREAQVVTQVGYGENLEGPVNDAKILRGVVSVCDVTGALNAIAAWKEAQMNVLNDDWRGGTKEVSLEVVT